MRDSVAFLLDTAGFDVRLYEAGTALLARLTRPLRGCILTDIRMPDLDGVGPVSLPSLGRSHASIVMMTGHGDVPLAVEAMSSGPATSSRSRSMGEALLRALQAALEQGGPKRPGSTDPAGLHAAAGDPERARAPGSRSSGDRGTSKEIGRRLLDQPADRRDLPAKVMAKTRAGSRRNWCAGPCSPASCEAGSRSITGWPRSCPRDPPEPAIRMRSPVTGMAGAARRPASRARETARRGFAGAAACADRPRAQT